MMHIYTIRVSYMLNLVEIGFVGFPRNGHTDVVQRPREVLGLTCRPETEINTAKILFVKKW